MKRLPYPEERVFSLVRHIQAAPLEDGGWARFNREMGSLFASPIGALYDYSKVTGSARLITSHGVTSKESEPYEKYYAARSLTQKDADRRALGLVYLESMSDKTVLARCEAYQDYFLPLRAGHLALINLRGLQSALHAAMDQLPHGVLLLDGHGHVVYANRPAEAILAADNGLALTRLGQCHAARSDEDARLAALISNCARAGAGGEPPRAERSM